MNQLPTIPWDSLSDDIQNCQRGYSFLLEPKNEAYHQKVMTFEKRRNSEVWICENDLNQNRIAKFKRTVTLFLEVLLCLVHVTGGQPARGTELIILQHANSGSASNDGRRNIYIDRGLVCIHTRYHKNIIKMNRAKDVFRFLPRRVGTLMIHYLSIVLPFYQKMTSPSEIDPKPSTYLWTSNPVAAEASNQVWDGRRLSGCLQRFFAKTIGIDMNTLSYRHIAIAIVQKYLYNHVTIKSKCSSDDQSSDDDENGEGDNIWDLQAAHSTNTRLNVYGRLINENDRSSHSIIDKFRLISVKWHNFVLYDDGDSHQEWGESSNTLRDQRIKRLARLMVTPPEDMLRNFMGTDAKLRGRQEDVLRSI